jgi:phytoene dehydrogenase-like protein
VVHVPFPDGTYLTQFHDIERTCAEFAKFSKKERRRLPAHDRRLRRGQADLRRRLLHADRLGQSRSTSGSPSIPTAEMAAADRDVGLGDHPRQFRGRSLPLVHAVDGVQTVVPPEWPLSGRLAYSLVYGRQRWSWCVPKGGSGAFSGAGAADRAHGGVILTDKRVHRLIVGTAAASVSNAPTAAPIVRQGCPVDGSHRIRRDGARAPPGAMIFVAGVDTWQAGPTLFVTHYATTEPMRFKVDGGVREPMAVGILSTPTRALRMGYDYARGAVNIEDPVLLAVCPTLADPGRAPPGKHTVKVIGFQPYDLAEGAAHWDEIKEQVSAANLSALRRFATNLTDDKILARVVEAPISSA